MLGPTAATYINRAFPMTMPRSGLRRDHFRRENNVYVNYSIELPKTISEGSDPGRVILAPAGSLSSRIRGFSVLF